MRRYALAALGVLLALVAVYLGIEALGVPLLSDPSAWMRGAGPAAAGVGVGLLIADVFVPVPSSFVMVMHGALFGVALGTLLSVVGGVGSTLLGFALGRMGAQALERRARPAERARAERLLARWGLVAIVLSRPVPLLAEAVAIVAGAGPLRWWWVALAAAAGNLPAALVYALTGAVAPGYGSAALVFALVLLTTALAWWAGRRLTGGARMGEAG